jgi:hypothetical protein
MYTWVVMRRYRDLSTVVLQGLIVYAWRVEKQTGSADNSAHSRKFHIPNNFLPNNIV